MKKKICWVTPDCFIDVDLNTNIVEYLLRYYDIHWIIILPRGSRFTKADFEGIIARNINLEVEFFYFERRARDLSGVIDYWKVYKQIKDVNSDLNYINYVPTTPQVFPLFLLPKKKTIYTAHDGYVKPGFRFAWVSQMSFEMSYRRVRFVNLFSPGQERIFLHHFHNVKTFVIPLGLKDFGQPTVSLRNDKISFLSFGRIHKDKNISLLIEAGEELYEEGEHDFVISINGTCRDWESYQKQINHPEIFEIDIRSVDNSEIANLFANNHYAVFPYMQSGQSGALKVAMQYNKPVIVSNLEGFLFDVQDGYNGFVFESENVHSLKMIMKRCIHLSKDHYASLQKNVKEYVSKRYSIEIIGEMYVNMFNSILNTK